MLPSSFWKQTTAHQQSRSSQAASAQQLSPRSTVTILPDPHLHPLDPVSPADPTAILPAPQAPSATTAPQAQAHVAVHVNVTVSLAEATVSSSTVEDPAVATVTIPALAVPPIPRPSTSRAAPAATDLSSDDDRFEFFETRREALAVHSLWLFRVCKTPTPSVKLVLTPHTKAESAAPWSLIPVTARFRCLRQLFMHIFLF